MEIYGIVGLTILFLFLAFIIFKIKKKFFKRYDYFEHRDKTNNKLLYTFAVNRKTGERKILNQYAN